MTPSTFAVLTVMLFLLGTPVGALLGARWLAGREVRLQRRVFGGLVAGLALVLLCASYGVGTSVFELNVLLAVLAYFAFGVLALSVFRLRPPMLGQLMGLVAVLPLALGVFASTVGALGLVFVLGDVQPVHRELMSMSRVCQVTSFGNATTSVDGYEVVLMKPVPVFSFIEIPVHRQRFTNPDFKADEACRRAHETDRSLLTPSR